MMMMTRSIAAAVLAVATSLCSAQGTASSPAKKELVQKIVQHQRPAFEILGNTIAGQMSNQILQMTGQAVARAPADKREALGNEAKADIKKFYDDASAVMREQAVRIAPTTVGVALEEKFSEDELKTLLAWLESPVSRKFQQVAGEIQQSMGQKVVTDTKPVIEPKLKALEQAISKKLADAGVAMKPKAAASAPKK
jgi:hypothetical protein